MLILVGLLDIVLSENPDKSHNFRNFVLIMITIMIMIMIMITYGGLRAKYKKKIFAQGKIK